MEGEGKVSILGATAKENTPALGTKVTTNEKLLLILTEELSASKTSGLLPT